MKTKQLVEKLASMEFPDTGEPLVPPPELVGFFIRWVRGLRNWKQATLAGFAQVSLSTIERVERGEKVSDECLDQIAQALGYEKGYFTAPRVRKTKEEAAADFIDTWANLEPVSVRPLCTEKQVRELIKCHAYLVHRPNVGDEYDSDIHALMETLDVTSFITSSGIGPDHVADVKRRELYGYIFDCVSRLEHGGLTVLAGVMSAPQPGFADWRLAIISVTPRLIDPGAIKRRTILVDRRCVELRSEKAA
jgi:transcriptional regulator with XRE-family HTH domain